MVIIVELWWTEIYRGGFIIVLIVCNDLRNIHGTDLCFHIIPLISRPPRNDVGKRVIVILGEVIIVDKMVIFSGAIVLCLLNQRRRGNFEFMFEKFVWDCLLLVTCKVMFGFVPDD